MRRRTQVVVVALAFLATACLAAESIRIHVMFRNQQLAWPNVRGTPETIERCFRPDVATNLEYSHAGHVTTPLGLFRTTFGTNSPNADWLFGLEILRYQPETTNFTVVKTLQYRDMKTNAAALDILQDGDVLFYHGCVD
jgi:hypothetical protein